MHVWYNVVVETHAYPDAVWSSAEFRDGAQQQLESNEDYYNHGITFHKIRKTKLRF